MFQSFDYSIRNTVHEEVKLIITNKIEDWVEENKPKKFLMWWNKNFVFSRFYV